MNTIMTLQFILVIIQLYAHLGLTRRFRQKDCLFCYWNFRDASGRKSLSFFFRANLRIRLPESEIAITLKRLKEET